MSIQFGGPSMDSFSPTNKVFEIKKLRQSETIEITQQEVDDFLTARKLLDDVNEKDRFMWQVQGFLTNKLDPRFSLVAEIGFASSVEDAISQAKEVVSRGAKGKLLRGDSVEYEARIEDNKDIISTETRREVLSGTTWRNDGVPLWELDRSGTEKKSGISGNTDPEVIEKERYRIAQSIADTRNMKVHIRENIQKQIISEDEDSFELKVDGSKDPLKVTQKDIDDALARWKQTEQINEKDRFSWCVYQKDVGPSGSSRGGVVKDPQYVSPRGTADTLDQAILRAKSAIKVIRERGCIYNIDQSASSLRWGADVEDSKDKSTGYNGTPLWKLEFSGAERRFGLSDTTDPAVRKDERRTIALSFAKLKSSAVWDEKYRPLK